MMNRKKGLLAQAFEATYYNRAISKEAPTTSVLSAVLALPTKYKKKGKDGVEVSKDRNVYNWAERLLWPATVVKNFAKLGTEYVWNFAAATLSEASDQLKAKANALSTDAYDEDDDSYLTNVKIFSLRALALSVRGLSFIPWMVAKIGQSITSPFAAMKETSATVQAKTGSKILAYLAAGTRGLVTVGAYAAIAVFAAPAIAVPLAASGSVGSQIVAGLGTAASWIGGLPVISTIGSAFATGIATVGSALGLSTAAGFASAAAIAAAAVVATPVLAGVKVLVRYLSHLKPKSPAAAASLRPSFQEPLLAAPGSYTGRPLTGLTQQQAQQRTASFQQLHQQPEPLSPLFPHSSSTHQQVRAAIVKAPSSASSVSTSPVNQPTHLQSSVIPQPSLSLVQQPTVAPVLVQQQEQQQAPQRTPTPIPTSSVLIGASTFSRAPSPAQIQLQQQQQQLDEEQQKMKDEVASPRSAHQPC